MTALFSGCLKYSVQNQIQECLPGQITHSNQLSLFGERYYARRVREVITIGFSLDMQPSQ
jgi:hypothetical protein